MNTDKIYAEQLANEYAPKDTSKVVALRKPDNKAKLPATIFTYTSGIITALVAGGGDVPMRSWSWPKRSANSKPWDGRGSSCKSCCISYYGTLLQRPCFSRKHQHLSGDCGQPFLCGVPRHGCHPLCLGMVSLHGGLLSGTGRSAGISDRLLSPPHSGIGTPMLSGCRFC